MTLNIVPPPAIQAKAEAAFEIYSALARLSRDRHDLGHTDLMRELHQIAYDRFAAEMIL